MAIKGIFYVFAHVSDLARSKRFYGETLGWTKNTDEHASPVLPSAAAIS
jgi:predicted enzyme related to lactoylglutathione lyase